MSDSSYVAVTRHRRPFSTAGRPAELELVDDEWVADVLEDDDLPTKPYETPLLDDDDLEGEPVVISTGTSSSAANHAEERRRREEGWNDLALDQIDNRETTANTAATINNNTSNNTSNNNTTGNSTQG